MNIAMGATMGMNRFARGFGVFCRSVVALVALAVPLGCAEPIEEDCISYDAYASCNFVTDRIVGIAQLPPLVAQLTRSGSLENPRTHGFDVRLGFGESPPPAGVPTSPMFDEVGGYCPILQRGFRATVGGKVLDVIEDGGRSAPGSGFSYCKVPTLSLRAARYIQDPDARLKLSDSSTTIEIRLGDMLMMRQMALVDPAAGELRVGASISMSWSPATDLVALTDQLEATFLQRCEVCSGEAYTSFPIAAVSARLPDRIEATLPEVTGPGFVVVGMGGQRFGEPWSTEYQTASLATTLVLPAPSDP